MTTEHQHKAKFERTPWDVFVLAIIVFSLVETPVSVVLGLKPLFTDHFVCLILIADCILRVRARQALVLKTGDAEHLNSYLRSRFIVDALAAFPYALLPFPPIMRLFRMLRILDMPDLGNYLGKLFRRLTSVSPALTRLTLIVFWTTLWAHWLACGWIALGGCADELPLSRRYLRSIYWAFTTLGTVGYGDITPQSSAQTIYSIFVMILGAGLYGYVIGTVASLIANLDMARVQHAEKMDRVNAFLRYRRISPGLSERVQRYYEYLWERGMVYDEQALIEELPPSIKTDLYFSIHGGIIEKVPLFREASEEFLREIVVALRPTVFTPGDLIVRKGEIGDEMYFINRGTVEVVSADQKEIFATLTDGNFFGEIALITNSPRNATIRAVDYCDLYTLDRDVFNKVLAKYPSFESKIRSMVEKRSTQRIQENWSQRLNKAELGTQVVEKIARDETSPKDAPPQDLDAPESPSAASDTHSD